MVLGPGSGSGTLIEFSKAASSSGQSNSQSSGRNAGVSENYHKYDNLSG